MVGNHQLINDYIIQVKQERCHGGRNPHGKHGLHALPAGPSHTGIEGNHRLAAHFSQNQQKIQACDAVGKGGGDSGSQNFKTVRQQHKHEQRVQQDIQQTAQDDARSGLSGTPDAPDQIGQHIGEDCGNPAKNDHTQGILSGKAVCIFPGSQNPQKFLHKQAGSHGERGGHQQGQTDGKQAYPPGLLFHSPPQQSGDQSSPSDAGQPRQTQGNVKYREDQGCGGYHIGISRLPHIKGIRHVVNQHDQLADDRGNYHDPQRRCFRQAFKDLFSVLF